ncbi:hypothetical protein GBZ48_12045 [Azospirillum melinis]|uniref:Uncharacterized protein n=1 Tax=Azospirillum melinis TaxID=328839 RepID=A0ABX2K8S7_9PROT|nr:hypothetical protein [Azospirillum melinis]MBP2307563.1 hypothetical protein [Azospirillum melinis]NUB00018.1 hypothetical protein [Azospirillum melinis]
MARFIATGQLFHETPLSVPQFTNPLKQKENPFGPGLARRLLFDKRTNIPQTKHLGRGAWHH